MNIINELCNANSFVIIIFYRPHATTTFASTIPVPHSAFKLPSAPELRGLVGLGVNLSKRTCSAHNVQN